MKRTATTIAGVCFMLVFLVPQAHALRAVLAHVVSGQVQVIGRQAARNANITWDGNIVTQANRGGAFQFRTTEVPPTCVGTLSDGVNTIQVVVTGCEPVAGSGSENIKATGQTTSYHAGDDGDLQLGAIRSYSDTGLTMIDLVTGLEWEKKCSSCGGNHDWSNGFSNWNGIWTWIAAVNAENSGAGYAGHNDWRIPNINELLTLVNYGKVAPASDTVFNSQPNCVTRPYGYWSSTSFPDDPSTAWYVDFAFGSVAKGNKLLGYYVRAVRGP
ncbi:MAG: DUF1566 domain-containing protein [Nitrospirota bacterium]